MEWIEVTGRTVEDAKELALDRLGVAEDDLEFEVIEEPKSGFLGRIGRTEARIRARVKPISREKPGDRRRRRAKNPRSRRESAGAASGGNGGTGTGSGTSTPARRGDGERGEGPSRTPGGGTGGGGGTRSRRSRGGGGRGPGGARGAAETDEHVDGDDEMPRTQEDLTVEHDVPLEEQAAAAAD